MIPSSFCQSPNAAKRTSFDLQIFTEHKSYNAKTPIKFISSKEEELKTELKSVLANKFKDLTDNKPQLNNIIYCKQFKVKQFSKQDQKEKETKQIKPNQ